MKRWMKGSMIALGVLSAVGTASGGLQFSFPVDVNLTGGYARGAMGDARNSADTVQYIGCYHSSMAGSTVVACEAQSAAGTYKSCVTTDPNMVATARGISPGSYVFFRWDASGACSSIQLTNYSWVRPSAP